VRHPRNVDPLASVGGREMSAPRGVKPASQAVLIVLAAALLLSAQEQPPQQPPQQPALAAPDAAPAQQQPVGEAPTEGAPQQGAAQGAAPLRVMVGKSLLINTTERLRRISENLATTTTNLDQLMSEHRDDLGSFMRDGLPEMERLVRDSRQAAQEFRELSRSLKADPSQLLYEPNYRGVEIPR